MVNRLKEDHDNAMYLATKLNEIQGFSVDMDRVHINMVFCKVERENFDFNKFADKLLEKGRKTKQGEKGSICLVTHKDINKEDINYAIKTIKKVLENFS